MLMSSEGDNESEKIIHMRVVERIGHTLGLDDQ